MAANIANYHRRVANWRFNVLGGTPRAGILEAADKKKAPRWVLLLPSKDGLMSFLMT